MRIPGNRFWPSGFTTDFVSVFPDSPKMWAPALWPPREWFRWRTVDLRVASWWHDLRYYLGYFVPSDMNRHELKKLVPIPNSARSDIQWYHIDRHFREDVIRAGARVWVGDWAFGLVHSPEGRRRYYWATTKRWATMARPWEGRRA